MINIENLKVVKNEKVILNNLKLKINKGDILYIIGPNGGGKTTLIKSILGIEKYQGKITLDVKKEKIGYVPQAKTFENRFPLTIEEAVSFFNKYEVDNELKMFGLFDIKDKIISELSGGQLQRVYIARAFVNDPDLIVMDEPDNALDSVWREKLIETISEKNKEGKTFIIATHDLTLMKSKISKILCINKTLHIHGSNEILTKDNLEKIYGCPIEFIGHSKINHKVLEGHKNE